MGNFIGGVGAAFIMAAAAAVIIKFLMEINVIKDREAAVRITKTSLVTIGIGAVYLAAIALMYNEIKTQKNFFDAEGMYYFLGINKTLELCRQPDIAGLFGALRMPLYPLLVHFLGGIVFKQYVHIALYISFTAASVSSCLMYNILRSRTNKNYAVDILLLLASLPYVFIVFMPTYVSLMIMFIICAAYALCSKRNKTYILFSILALLTGKAGILAFALYPFRHRGAAVIKFIESKLLQNRIVFRIVLTILLLINGAVIFALVRGIKG